MGCSDQCRGYDGLVWMSWTSRMSLRYLLLLELLFGPPTIMLIDLLACWNGPLGLPVSGRGGRLRSSQLFWLLVITSPVVTVTVVPTATSVVAEVVVVATRG
jgi:hypothetical protein